MGQFSKLRKEAEQAGEAISLNIESQEQKYRQMADISGKVSEAAANSDETIRQIGQNFKSMTKLTAKDYGFLATAIALQCVRWSVLTPGHFVDRADDKHAASESKKKERGLFQKQFNIDTKDENGRGTQEYYPSLEEIIINPVPFDTQDGSPQVGANLGGGKHRNATLGHDPVLGWIFGTANIVTSTATIYDFRTFHIGYKITGKHKYARDAFTKPASTGKMFGVFLEKCQDPKEGWPYIAAGVIKEYFHLKSDVLSKESLPIPGTELLSPKFAGKLAEFGVDTANVMAVGKQATYAIAINGIISMLHRLTYGFERDIDEDLLQVRTRKILSYSNMIASTSNVLYVALSRDVNRLDIGGIMVTLWRIISDSRFKAEIEREYLRGEFNKRILAIADDMPEW